MTVTYPTCAALCDQVVLCCHGSFVCCRGTHDGCIPCDEGDHRPGWRTDMDALVPEEDRIGSDWDATQPRTP